MFLFHFTERLLGFFLQTFVCPHCDDASVAFADQPTLRRHEREVHKVFRYKCAQMRSILTHVKDPASLRIAKKDGTVVAANDDDVKTLSYNTVETAVEEKEMEIDEAELTSPTGRTRRRAAVRYVITIKIHRTPKDVSNIALVYFKKKTRNVFFS